MVLMVVNIRRQYSLSTMQYADAEEADDMTPTKAQKYPLQ
jgi:hypothetical protein